jgi:hypothetical protein
MILYDVEGNGGYGEINYVCSWVNFSKEEYDLKMTLMKLYFFPEGSAGGGIRARDFWTSGAHVAPFSCSPDYESGALARLGYPGF